MNTPATACPLQQAFENYQKEPKDTWDEVIQYFEKFSVMVGFSPSIKTQLPKSIQNALNTPLWSSVQLVFPAAMIVFHNILTGTIVHIRTLKNVHMTHVNKVNYTPPNLIKI